MRVLLRNEETGLYYAGRQRWIPDSEHALDFGSIEEAKAMSREENHPAAEVFLSYENPGLRSRFLRRPRLSCLEMSLPMPPGISPGR